jgi:hypothetical protein
LPEGASNVHWAGLTGAAAFAVFASPAIACPPPQPPTPEELRLRVHQARERATARFQDSTDIVYGVVTRPARQGGIARFRILHTYKGSLRPGATITVRSVDYYDLHPPDCPIPRPVLVARGGYGVLAFSGERPALDFMDSCTLDYWFRNRWIVRHSAARPLWSGGSGTLCAVYDYEPVAGVE